MTGGRHLLSVTVTARVTRHGRPTASRSRTWPTAAAKPAQPDRLRAPSRRQLPCVLEQEGARFVTVPALALEPVLIDTGGPSIRTLDDQLLDRAGRDDYRQWLAGTTAAGGCIRPIRLSGTIRDIDPVTGQILRTLDTSTLPDKVIYTPCGDRRASVCPACAETYRRDTYQLIRAGLAGGKGVPDSISRHPAVFATFTALCPASRGGAAKHPWRILLKRTPARAFARGQASGTGMRWSGRPSLARIQWESAVAR